MDMYIEIKDGALHNHPILAENLVHAGYDLNNLPSNFVKYVRDDYSTLSTTLKPGQWLEYFTEYNTELKIVFEYAMVVGEPIIVDVPQIHDLQIN